VTDALRAEHELAFSYRRSVGGADRVFLAGLARGEIWGSRGADGRVSVPPEDWDPETGAPAVDVVRVGDGGVVRTWSWIAEPQQGDPLGRPHALALVQLDGADTALLHVVDADQEEMHTGMRVQADWRPDRVGSVRDIRAFVSNATKPAGAPRREPPDPPPDLLVESDTRIRYQYEPGITLTRFLRGLADRRIEGGRCPHCDGVYVPPHPQCPACRTGPLAPVPMTDRGTVSTYTVVHMPFHGMTIDLPFVCAWIRLDGASVPFAHLLGEIAPDQVEVGMRVQAVWVADEELAPTWESIRYFRPEPR
jgi:uncharacterized OB-fold protein